ncbi:contractile injection system protein, VgrG/Pvc8 family [Candidatus Nitronereus thalassa]|uniref:Contractile injection system protein, VgrG/Pvc8 family n=1 Tax=Candidatus Nitronereus thalassa TaxID=3020898 RepID=A0ABU3K504_9BACT|nr:contractile injection system protein, VgrG/Pvc8 family [Candidatus Nitronereus thalassa]MDT7041463.1 contractile injection system protein, VgrG/Pvc8 family [Candidatus Nitronereus thalassa]
MLETSDFSVSLRPEILIDGTVVEKLGEHLLEMQLTSSVQGHAVASARFLNWGSSSSSSEPNFLYFDQAYLDFGRKIMFRVKSGDSALILFSGQITAIEGHTTLSYPPEIVITAEDRLSDFGLLIRNRIFESVTDADILNVIAGEHGLTPQISLGGPTHERVVQFNQTDLGFCFERVRAAGGELWIEDNTLHAVTREERMSGPIDLAMGKNLIQFHARADLQGQGTELRVTGWDVGMKQRITGVGKDSSLGGSVSAGGQTAAKILKEFTGGHTLIHEVKSLPTSGEQAQTLAKQFYREKAGEFVRATGKALDHPELRVGTVVNISQVGSFFEGDYYLIAVTHSFSSLTGFQTEFVAERAWLNRKAPRRSKKEVTGDNTIRKKPILPRKPISTNPRNTSRPVVRRVPGAGQRRKRP